MVDKNQRKETFISRAKAIAGNECIDYSQVEYVNNRTPVKLIDHSLRPDGTEYGEFWQSPTNHLKGQQHPDKRSMRISKTQTLSQDEVITRFKEVHKGEKMDYSEVEYKGMHIKVKIICRELDSNGKEYGIFWQEPSAHLRGCNHPRMALDRQSSNRTYTSDKFIEKASKIFPDYDYSQVDYKGTWEKVSIVCPKHGVFQITPNNFLQGKGCPACGNHLSRAEDDISEFINELGINTVRRDHSVLGGNNELDILIPSHNIAIEFDGIRWHSELFGKNKYYHLSKTLKCQERGVNLIHIFEDEYLQHKNIVLHKLKHILGCDNNIESIFARKCTVRCILPPKDFLNKFHIQGYVKATVHLGAFYNDQLVGVMSFLERYPKEWELVRFATDWNYRCVGVGGKLFKYFTKNYQYREIKSFLDRRWCFNADENLYTKLGFTNDGITKPDYSYTDGHSVRLHKFGFRKHILLKKYPDKLHKDMTENEMTKELGYYRIWNCGLIRYVYKNPELQQ